MHSFKKKENIWSVSEALEQMLKDNNLTNQYYERTIVTATKEILGTALMQYISQITLKNKKLYIKTSSSIVKNELQMLHSQLLARLPHNENKQYVNEVVIL
ncbi:MAG: DUF721 domain-containing protein [Bacteroidales bacterium]|nr:DUF721 domain-containing protein [Bacteroidales bacterium]